MFKYFLLFLITLSSAQSNELTLYFIKSPSGLDWSSATSLSRSIITNYVSFKRNFMGHVNIELNCKNPQDVERKFLTGMVAKNLNAKKLLFWDDIGLGIVFHSFSGHLETREELTPVLSKYLAAGDRINFVTYKINPKTCERVHEYYLQWKQQDLEKYYGLYNRPLHKEGSGCSAFGASFLKVAGIMNEEFEKSWSYRVKIPLEYIGRPLRDSHISFLKLLLFDNQWAKENQPSKEIYFWDPDRMHSWVSKHTQNTNSVYKLISKQNAKGLLIDAQMIQTPKGSVWKKDDRVLPIWPN